MARLGKAGQGKAWQGKAGQGWARHGSWQIFKTAIIKNKWINYQ